MGAHTLGGCKPQNSGYNGSWIDHEPNYFNQKYYQYILSGEREAMIHLHIDNKVQRITNLKN